MGEFPQLVEILFDASLSMNDPFTVEEETSLSGSRMGMAKSFVEIFVSSISKTKIRYGLTTFNTRVQTKVKVTDPPSDIRSVLRDIRANGHTKCFAAMSSVAKTMCSATEQIKRISTAWLLTPPSSMMASISSPLNVRHLIRLVMNRGLWASRYNHFP